MCTIFAGLHSGHLAAEHFRPAGGAHVEADLRKGESAYAPGDEEAAVQLGDDANRCVCPSSRGGRS